MILLPCNWEVHGCILLSWPYCRERHPYLYSIWTHFSEAFRWMSITTCNAEELACWGFFPPWTWIFPREGCPFHAVHHKYKGGGRVGALWQKVAERAHMEGARWGQGAAGQETAPDTWSTGKVQNHSTRPVTCCCILIISGVIGGK